VKAVSILLSFCLTIQPPPPATRMTASRGTSRGASFDLDAPDESPEIDKECLRQLEELEGSALCDDVKLKVKSAWLKYHSTRSVQVKNESLQELKEITEAHLEQQRIQNAQLKAERKTLVLDNRSLLLDNRSLLLDNRSLLLDNRSLLLDNRCLRLINRLLKAKLEVNSIFFNTHRAVLTTSISDDYSRRQPVRPKKKRNRSFGPKRSPNLTNVRRNSSLSWSLVVRLCKRSTVTKNSMPNTIVGTTSVVKLPAFNLNLFAWDR
jgi:hypothetical protein